MGADNLDIGRSVGTRVVSVYPEGRIRTNKFSVRGGDGKQSIVECHLLNEGCSTLSYSSEKCPVDTGGNDPYWK